LTVLVLRIFHGLAVVDGSTTHLILNALVVAKILNQERRNAPMKAREKIQAIARKLILLSLIKDETDLNLTEKQLFGLAVELLDREASKIEKEELGYD